MRRANRAVSPRKSAQLQIRISPAQKRAIQRAAARAGMGASEWVLSRALPAASDRFQEVAAAVARAERPSHAFAEVNDFLAALTPAEFSRSLAEAPRAPLDGFRANYLAAMVELTAARVGVAAPAWTRAIAPLAEPAFGSALASLRLHLLLNSPPPFRRRNLFIDSSIGDRV